MFRMVIGSLESDTCLCSLRAVPCADGPHCYCRALKREKLTPTLTPPTECHVGKGLVSVVVPAYNEGDGIKLTLTTIDELAQVRCFSTALLPLLYVRCMLLPCSLMIASICRRHAHCCPPVGYVRECHRKK